MAQIPLGKLLVIAGVAVLVGLAGCNTGGNGTPTATGTDDATTDTAPEPLEEIDGEQLTNATAATIEEAGSYTLSQSGSFESSGPQGESSTDSNSTTRVDFEAERGIRETSQTFTNANQTRELETSVYTDGDTSYRQRNSSQGVQYASQTGDGTGLSAIRTVNVTSFPQNYTAVTDGFEWEANGTETIDGTPTVRYTSTNVSDSSTFVGVENVTVRNASSTLYVDSDNVIRRASLEYTVEDNSTTYSIETTVTLTDIGSTTVEEPDWLSEAQATETPAQ